MVVTIEVTQAKVPGSVLKIDKLYIRINIIFSLSTENPGENELNKEFPLWQFLCVNMKLPNNFTI